MFAAHEQEVVWGELWQTRRFPHDPYTPTRKVGDLVPLPPARLPWDLPSPVYRVVEVLGGPTEAEYLAGTTARHPAYCYFRGVLVEGHPVQAEVCEPSQREDSRLGRHLANLEGGD